MSDRGLLRFAVWSVQGPGAPPDQYMYLYANTDFRKPYSTATTTGSLVFASYDVLKHDDATANTPPDITQVGFPPGSYHIALQIYPYQPNHPNLTGLVTRTARIRLQYPGPGTTILATATGSVPRSGGLLTASCDYTTADPGGFGITVDLSWAADSPSSDLYFGPLPGPKQFTEPIFTISADPVGWSLVVEGTRSDI